MPHRGEAVPLLPLLQLSTCRPHRERASRARASRQANERRAGGWRATGEHASVRCVSSAHAKAPAACKSGSAGEGGEGGRGPEQVVGAAAKKMAARTHSSGGHGRRHHSDGRCTVQAWRAHMCFGEFGTSAFAMPLPSALSHLLSVAACLPMFALLGGNWTILSGRFRADAFERTRF